MPLEAPVTTATWPCKDSPFMLVSFPDLRTPESASTQPLPHFF
jgi:hypothetical protein